MIRTVIVDDEVLATVGLKAMIDWPAHGFEIVGEGDNGESGLEVIRRLRPDVVITDIMMPRIDGLEMMKRVLAELPGTRFVVLSGYNEFSLVKKALRQGARDYLLKLSLRPETLLETLDALRGDIRPAQAGADASGTAAGVPRQPPAGREVRRELRRAVEGHGEPAHAAAALQALGLPADADLRLALVRVYPHAGTEQSESDEGGMSGMGGMLVDMIGKLATDFCPAYCFQWDENGYLLLLAAERTGDGQRVDQEMEDIGGSLIRLLGQYVNLEAAVGVSGPCGSADALPRAFTQAERAVDRSFYDGFGRVYLPDGAEPAQPGPQACGQSCTEVIEQAIATCDPSLARQAFERVYSRIHALRPQRAEALENICHLLTLIDARLGDEWRESPERRAIELHARVFRLYSLDELSAFLDEYCGLVGDRLVQLRHNNTQGIILKARRYVAENIDRRITLRETASRLHVSSGYLSTLFPRVMHTRFSDYVNQAKIREAQDMIRSGRFRVFEVSDALAFQTPSYFSKTFRKFAGCSPSEYARRVESERDNDKKDENNTHSVKGVPVA